MALRFVVALILIALFGSQPAMAHSGPLGAQFAYTLGATTGPFRTDHSLYFNGTLDFPIFRSDAFFGQQFMAEFMFGHARGTAGMTPTITNGLRASQVEITTFHFFLGGKYKFTKLGEEGRFLRKLQPYLVAGPLFNLFLCRTKEGESDRAACGASPLSPELQDRGIPMGSGDVRFDYSLGGGIDFLLTDRVFLGADFRQSFSSPNARYRFGGAKAGFVF